MMIPLLLGARPQFSSRGPVVSLHDGNWEIFTDRVVSSKLELHRSVGGDSSKYALNGVAIRILGPCVVQVFFLSRGNEDYVSVYARAA